MDLYLLWAKLDDLIKQFYDELKAYFKNNQSLKHNYNELFMKINKEIKLIKLDNSSKHLLDYLKSEVESFNELVNDYYKMLKNNDLRTIFIQEMKNFVKLYSEIWQSNS